MHRFVTGVRAVTVALRLAWARAARARCPPGRHLQVTSRVHRRAGRQRPGPPTAPPPGPGHSGWKGVTSIMIGPPAWAVTAGGCHWHRGRGGGATATVTAGVSAAIGAQSLAGDRGSDIRVFYIFLSCVSRTPSRRRCDAAGGSLHRDSGRSSCKLQRLSSAASERPQNELQSILRDGHFHSDLRPGPGRTLGGPGPPAAVTVTAAGPGEAVTEWLN